MTPLALGKPLLRALSLLNARLLVGLGDLMFYCFLVEYWLLLFQPLWASNCINASVFEGSNTDQLVALSRKGCSCWLLTRDTGRRAVTPLLLSGISSLNSCSLFSSVISTVSPVPSKAAEYGGGLSVYRRWDSVVWNPQVICVTFPGCNSWFNSYKFVDFNI